MHISVKPRSFFETRKGEKQEKHHFCTNRIISINSIPASDETLPFSMEYSHADNVLVLYINPAKPPLFFEITEKFTQRCRNLSFGRYAIQIR